MSGGGLRRVAAAFDRTAVLAVGLVAGFAIGLSFNAGGRRQAIGWLAGDAPHALPVAAAPAELLDRDRPELAALLDPRVVRRAVAAGRLRVGVFGDSYGDGVWAALSHQLREKDRWEVLRFSKEATGFTRYRTLNLEDRARGQLADQPIDIAVISFGANDIQPIFEGGHLRPLMGPDWQAIIGERIARFVRIAQSTGAAVFWVGLPVMRDDELDESVQAMNAFYAARMKALGVPYVPTRALSLDRQGRYNQYLPDSETGAPRLMRTNDGIHMTILGYQRLTAGLAARLRGDAALVWRRAGLAPPEPKPSATPSPTSSAVPSALPSATPNPRATPRADERPRPAASAATAATATAADAERLKTARANRREADRLDPAPTPSASPRPSPTPDAERQKTARANHRENKAEKVPASAASPIPAAEPARAREP